MGQWWSERWDRTGERWREKNELCPSTILWQSADTDTDTAPTLLRFDEPTGPRISLPSSPQPVDFLSTFLDEDILGQIVEETNRYNVILPTCVIQRNNA